MVRFPTEQLTFPSTSSKGSIGSCESSYGRALGVLDPYCHRILLVTQVTKASPDSMGPVIRLDLLKREAVCEYGEGSDC